jgi:biotin synthase
MNATHTQWNTATILELYNRPLIELINEAAQVHAKHHTINEVQVSTLLSIKTGGCPEDCGYCPQAARYHTGVEAEGLMDLYQVKAQALRAKAGGSSRLCLGAAWRNVRDDKEFDHVLEMVRTVNETGLEVCATLGMLTEKQAQRLADAGLYAYNHNLDSSEEYYQEIISTRGYGDRLQTIANVRKTGLTVCSGGIIGMGESAEDRCAMLSTYAAMETPPESVPINALVAVEGTPLEDQAPISIWEMVRMIAVTRIVLPTSVVRLSAGRTEMSDEGQALCFLAGAGSIFAGDKLLTTPNPDINRDMELFKVLGITPMKPYSKGEQPVVNERYRSSAEGEKRIKWSRPGHHIERNAAKSVKLQRNENPQEEAHG